MAFERKLHLNVIHCTIYFFFLSNLKEVITFRPVFSELFYLRNLLFSTWKKKKNTMFKQSPPNLHKRDSDYYLAQKLCFWRGIIFIGVYLSVCVCVCLSVCLCVCGTDNSKSSWPILMKLGRMVYNDKSSVPFADEIDHVDRTQTSPNRVVKIDIKATYLLISQ